MKQFLIIGNVNALTYSYIFPLIKEKNIGIGYNCLNKFMSPEKEVITGPACRWFSNLEIDKENTIQLAKKYEPDKYDKYENYDAINCDKVKDIPYDYNGYIGVPITILDNLNTDGMIESNYGKYEVIGKCENLDLYNLKTRLYSKDECKKAYYDKFKKKGVYDMNARGVIIKNGIREKVYERVIIRRIVE